MVLEKILVLSKNEEVFTQILHNLLIVWGKIRDRLINFVARRYSYDHLC